MKKRKKRNEQRKIPPSPSGHERAAGHCAAVQKHINGMERRELKEEKKEKERKRERKKERKIPPSPPGHERAA